jgi:hypothetical protein
LLKAGKLTEGEDFRKEDFVDGICQDSGLRLNKAPPVSYPSDSTLPGDPLNELSLLFIP